MLRVWPPTLSAYEFVETRGKPKIDQRGEHIGSLSGSTSRMWMRCAGRSASPNPQTGNAQQRGSDTRRRGVSRQREQAKECARGLLNSGKPGADGTG